MSDLTDISSNFALYLTSLSPQVKNGSLQYYLSGSLATMIMANAESITDIDLDKSNNIVGDKSHKNISEEQRKRIAMFSRKLGSDVDIVNVNGNLFHGAPKDNKPNIQNVIRNVPQILELMSWQSTIGGSMYIDNLEGDRQIDYHPVSRVRTKKGDFYVTAPPEQLAHKLSETILLRTCLGRGNDSDDISKYEKDIRDLSAMFYGYKDLYDRDELLSRVFYALDNKRDSLFSTKNSRYNSRNSIRVQEAISNGIMPQIIDDCANYLTSIASSKSAIEMRDFFSDLIGKRKDTVEKMFCTEITPLKQKEMELSRLEAEARKIDEDELQKKSSKSEERDIKE